MAPLAETGTVIGHVTKEVAARTGLAEGTPLIMGIGDQQSACLGVGCIEEGIGYACGGTAGITAGKSNKMLRDPDRKCYVLGTPDGAYVMAVSYTHLDVYKRQESACLFSLVSQ